jgi:hypothetical protein
MFNLLGAFEIHDYHNCYLNLIPHIHGIFPESDC